MSWGMRLLLPTQLGPKDGAQNHPQRINLEVVTEVVLIIPLPFPAGGTLGTVTLQGYRSGNSDQYLPETFQLCYSRSCSVHWLEWFLLNTPAIWIWWWYVLYHEWGKKGRGPQLRWFWYRFFSICPSFLLVPNRIFVIFLPLQPAVISEKPTFSRINVILSTILWQFSLAFLYIAQKKFAYSGQLSYWTSWEE